MKYKVVQLGVMERFMSPAELEAFMVKYEASKKTDYKTRAVNETDKQIFADYKSGIKVSQLAKKYNISQGKIQSSILIAVRG